MNKFLAVVALVALTGFGCAAKAPVASGPANTQTYENAEYGFSFMYPANDEVHVRDADLRADTYLGQKMDFFASLRDLHRTGETAAINLAFLYAAKGLTVAQFRQGLEESGKNVAVKGVVPVTINGIALTKVTSTTDIGVDKVHYLLERNGTTVVFSVFINENKNFDPILQTLKVQ